VLSYQKGRTLLAIGGVFVAVLLIFVELGFFIAVPRGGMLIYDHMRFDLLLTSDQYIFQAESGVFPLARLATARTVPGIAQASAFYLGDAKWQDPGGGLRIDISVIGVDPRARNFAVPGIEDQSAVMERPDTVLVDDSTRSIFGSLATGRAIELDGHPATIGGQYTLGVGFLGLGVVLADEANFFRIFPQRPRDTVDLGLVTLQPDADLARVESALRAALPANMQVFTRDELTSREVAYWTTRTATGMIFGSGLIVAFVVGIMVLYQTLATQIARQLPQFAMLKAIGYTNMVISAIVLIQALIVMVAAFVPALAAAYGLYAEIRRET